MTDPRSAMPPYAPRPHQAGAIEAVSSSFASRDGDDLRARITMMCGTGKTLTAQRTVERLVRDDAIPASGRVLLLFPSLALVQQTFDSWVEQQMPGYDFRALAFCSGGRRARDCDDIAESALTMSRTTDPTVLADWLGRDDADTALSVVFGTYQSSATLASIHRDHDASPWDLIVADEAHNTTGDLTSVWATALHQDQIPARHRLFMTATPKVHVKRGRKVTNAADLGIASMCDETIYGPKVYDYSMPQAIADGVLNDYEVVILGVTDSEVRAYIEDHPAALAEISEDARRDEVLAAIALLKASKEFGLSRVLTFHRTVQRAEDFAAHLPAIAASFPATELHAPALQALTVKGVDCAEHRAAVLRALRNTGNQAFTSISNCKVFAEGVDAPTLDGELIADARTSPVEVTQIVGRVIRLNKMREGKSAIILPVLDDETLDVHDRLAGSSFDKVWQTIIALAEHDIEMQADLDRLRDRAARNTDETTTSGDDLRAPTAGTAEGAGAETDAPTRPLRKVRMHLSASLEPAAVLAAFEARVVASCVDVFAIRLASVADFIRRTGRVPRTSPAADPAERSLGNWLSDRKGEDRRGLLAPEKCEAIQTALNPLLGDWNPQRQVTSRRKRPWEALFEDLRDFHVAEGRWPRRTRTAGQREVNLAIWLNAQRSFAAQDSLAEDRWLRLDSLGNWRDLADGKFETTLRELVAWIEQNQGRAPRGKSAEPVERRLGTWLTQNRHKARTGKMSRTRVALLISAGLLHEVETATTTAA